MPPLIEAFSFAYILIGLALIFARRRLQSLFSPDPAPNTYPLLMLGLLSLIAGFSGLIVIHLL